VSKLLKWVKALYFVEHIQGHLDEGEQVICKICGKSIKEIYDETIKEE
jgi:hypothetical protein